MVNYLYIPYNINGNYDTIVVYDDPSSDTLDMYQRFADECGYNVIIDTVNGAYKIIEVCKKAQKEQ